jgi:hypothetical protein
MINNDESFTYHLNERFLNYSKYLSNRDLPPQLIMIFDDKSDLPHVPMSSTYVVWVWGHVMRQREEAAVAAKKMQGQEGVDMQQPSGAVDREWLARRHAVAEDGCAGRTSEVK